MFVYLDNSATTKQYPEVTKRMALAAENYYGNPSSLHTMGVEAEKRLREARKMAAKGFGASENEIIFTSGGTESDNTAIFGAARKKRRDGNKIITSKVEHPAVLEAMKRLADDGFQIEYIGVDSKCRLDMEQLKAAVDDKTILISIMMVNNETGTVMPVREIAKIKGNALFHVDAVQAFGKVDISGTGADLVAVSGHKIHGGISAFIVEKTDPGFSIGKTEDKMGIHASSTTELIFQNCEIPEDRLLGEIGDGFKVALSTLDGGRIGIASQALGIAQGAFDVTVEYMKSRKQFGKKLSQMEALQFEMADLKTRIEAARLLVYKAAFLEDKHADYGEASAMAKLFAAETAMKVTTKCVQFHGGYGYTADYPVERMMRDAKITEIYEGTSEVQKIVIAARTFGK